MLMENVARDAEGVHLPHAATAAASEAALRASTNGWAGTGSDRHAPRQVLVCVSQICSKGLAGLVFTETETERPRDRDRKRLTRGLPEPARRCAWHRRLLFVSMGIYGDQWSPARTRSFMCTSFFETKIAVPIEYAPV